jgi:hypothetical protein
MKTHTFFILSLLAFGIFFSCVSNASIEKPQDLIEEAIMERILYDVMVLNTMSTFKPKNPEFESVFGTPYIYKKYGIDSLQLVTSDQYYAKFPRQYFRMYSNVLERMKKTKDSLSELGKLEKKNQ